METILPYSCRIMPSSTARVQTMGPLRFTRRIRSQSASVDSTKGPTRSSPALLTRMCTASHRARISPTTASTRGLSLMSARHAAPCPPSLIMASTVSAAPASLRSSTATRAPSRASARAMPRPMPLAAPVTMATRFVRRMGSAHQVGQLVAHIAPRLLGGLAVPADRGSLPEAGGELVVVEDRPEDAGQPRRAARGVFHIGQEHDGSAYIVEAVMGVGVHRDLGVEPRLLERPH